MGGERIRACGVGTSLSHRSVMDRMFRGMVRTRLGIAMVPLHLVAIVVGVGVDPRMPCRGVVSGV